MLGRWIAIIWGRALELLRPVIARLSPIATPYVEQARARYQKLEPREKVLVRIAGGLVTILFVYNFMFLPIMNFASGLQDRIIQRQTDVLMVRRLSTNYAQMKAELKVAEHNTIPSVSNFSLFSVLEGTLTTSVGREKIASITPGSNRKLPDGFLEYSVELKLENVTLAQLTDALYGINTLKEPVGVETIRIQRRTQDTHSYDVDLTCVALAKTT
ncbi:MAG TPA: type II secretion system protein GspM [Candidatus Binataceae bacterium]|nr:type II secretion system protein GspM [Candidatus Binataceae bacterium]